MDLVYFWRGQSHVHRDAKNTYYRTSETNQSQNNPCFQHRLWHCKIFFFLIVIRGISSTRKKKKSHRRELTKIKGSRVRTGKEHRRSSTFVTLKSLMKTMQGSTYNGGWGGGGVSLIHDVERGFENTSKKEMNEDHITGYWTIQSKNHGHPRKREAHCTEVILKKSLTNAVWTPNQISDGSYNLPCSMERAITRDSHNDRI